MAVRSVTRKNKQWLSSCEICNGIITNNGSGRPRNVCSSACFAQRMRNTSKRRYVPRPHGNKPKKLKRQRSMIAAEKQHRGKCAYHMNYFGCDLLVTHDLIAIFEFDHIDRLSKLRKGKNGHGIGGLAGTVDDEILFAEMAKCHLVCSNCHRLKTVEKQDGRHLKERPVTTQLELQLK